MTSIQVKYFKSSSHIYTSSKLSWTECLTVLATAQKTRVSLVKASKNKANPATDQKMAIKEGHFCSKEVKENALAMEGKSCVTYHT